jgi:surface antigen
MITIKIPRRPTLLALAAIVAVAAVLVGWMVTRGTAHASGPSNDYPWSGATDCSNAQNGPFSWCMSGSDMSPLGFGYNNCTDYAAYELNEALGGTVSKSNQKFNWSHIETATAAFPKGDGNAYAWKQGAIDDYGPGTVNGTPAVGAVAWWGGTPQNSYGHVGIVASVSADGKSIVVYSYNMFGNGAFSHDPISTTSTRWPTWPNAFLHIADTPGSTSGGGTISPSAYAGEIVQWDNGLHAQKTAWLVSPDLKRYWIPDVSTFTCLQSSGFAVAGTLSANMLNQLPDQKNHWARCGGATLGTNQYLFRGSSLTSSNGQYHLNLRKSDGNLVLQGPTGATLWSNDRTSDYLVMQPDGNLVTYSYKGGLTWASNTANSGADHLVVTNDGHLALYTSGDLLKWTTAVGSKPVNRPPPPAPSPPTPPTVVTVVAQPPAPPPPPPPPTWTEQEGDYGANSFSDPHNASGMGTHLAAMAYVQVSCKLYDPTIASVNPDGYWYRIASAPWSNNYYVAANTFWNGDIPGHKPYTHNTDWNVPNC